MKINDGKLIRILILVPVLCVLVFAVYQRTEHKRADTAFREEIQNLDDLIRQGRMSEAGDYIRGLDNTRLASYQYLQLLRRCRIVDDSSDSSGMLLEFSRAAARMFPGREEFWAIYSIELLKNGQAEKAAEIAGDYISTPRFLSIGAQAALDQGSLPGSELVETASKSDYAWVGLLEAVREPSDDRLNQLGTSYNIPEFKADAAILAASRGDLTQSVDILKNTPLNRFPELSLQLAYDAGDSAFGIFIIQRLTADHTEQVPLYLLYQAQFLFEQGHVQESLNSYQRIINLESDFSVIPYINSYLLDPSKEVDILERGLDAFPESTALLEQLGEGYYKARRYTEAEEIYTRLSAMRPGYVRAQVRLKEMADGAGSKGSEAALWEAYQNEEYGDSLGLMLAWKLYGLHDAKGLELLSARQEKRQGPDIHAIRGLYFTIDGRFARAAEEFNQANLDNPAGWEYLYDKGIVEINQKEYEDAVDSLQQVDLYLNNRGTVSSKTKSMIWLALGEAQLGLGDLANGVRSLDYALDLDAGNFKASLLRRSINP